MAYPSIVFSEPGSSDLLCFAHQSFLAESVRLIYYVSPLNRFSEPGVSDLLCFTDQSFLAKSVRLIYYVLYQSLGWLILGWELGGGRNPDGG